MRILITGFGGFAGRHLAEHLRSEMDGRLWGTVMRSREIGALADLGAEGLVAGDLREREVVDRAFNQSEPDLVFHLAAQASVAQAWRDPWPTLETNLRMSLHVLEAARARSEGGQATRVVFVSSNEVYGGPAPDTLPTDEDAPFAPSNPYATSKAAADLLAGQYARGYGMDVVRVRPFNHLGPGQDARFVAASFARQIAEIEVGLRPPLVRVGNLSAERDFSDVRDIVRGYALAAVHGRPGRVYNLGRGEAVPVQALLDHFVARARVPVTVEADPERMRPSDVPRTLCDRRRAEQELGWTPRLPLASSLDDVLADWRTRVARAVDSESAPAPTPPNSELEGNG